MASKRGKGISNETRQQIVGNLEKIGADKSTGEVPRGAYVKTGTKFEIHYTTEEYLDKIL